MNEHEEAQLFVTSYFTSKNLSESRLIDNSCTNHIAYDEEILRGLDRYVISKSKSIMVINFLPKE